MSASLKAKVLGNRPVGPQVHLMTLAAPAIAAKARPGQFVMLRVSPGPEPLLARPFSIHGVEGESLLVLYQVVGKGTGLLKEVAQGQELTMWGPLGRGFELGGDDPLLVAGGMGIAPLAFAAESLEQKGASFRAMFGIGSREAFTAWDAVSGDGDCYLEHWDWAAASEDGSLGREGLVTALLAEALDRRTGPVLACGPLPMLKAVARLCDEHGVPCQVSLEAPMACGVGACLGCAIPAKAGGYLRACQEGPVMDAALVDWGRI
ncbi:MAG: dihydroorotate dehydrogenase electron transfer subunit [Desulfarculaceae bacterium]|nr:dihydroorotate dehydrogenase electron transfer subunit [Desulfarculaceae bacterium]MCF8072612.1 dihydroorotate dehydrogenase electron transfer subunit [Desulfarculaceae bacterium]MCF8103316.1 dihydroorotate dehydrogenase electron transfer subunit [Desulfarculaceae bacterium]MCF8117798.1 dihydroorotate dehydrogenase electron transfer subunit [Desulfarculaceae bacterium]